jgi:acetyl esterase/lipase
MRRAVVLPEYRLAPEHPFPAAVDDVVAAITESLREDTELLVGGDSAGGGIVLAALMKLRDRGMLLPKGAAVICPFADLSLSGESWGAPETRDEIITAEPTAAVAAMYVSAAEASDPLVSPVFGDWEGLPPLLILASACESLRSDAERVAQHATAAGVPVRLLLWPDLPHDWPVHSPGLTASSEALTAIAEWAAPL